MGLPIGGKTSIVVAQFQIGWLGIDLLASAKKREKHT